MTERTAPPTSAPISGEVRGNDLSLRFAVHLNVFTFLSLSGRYSFATLTMSSMFFSAHAANSVGLAVAVATVTPFTQGGPAVVAAVTALINLAAGTAILSLLSGVGAAARAEHPAEPPKPAAPWRN